MLLCANAAARPPTLLVLGDSLSAAFGIPHDELGEELVLAVAPRRWQSIDADAMREHLGERLAGFKVPAHIIVSPEPLPKSASGKVLKRQIRQPFIDQQAAVH